LPDERFLDTLVCIDPLGEKRVQDTVEQETTMAFRVTSADAGDTDQPAHAAVGHGFQQDRHGFREQRRATDVARAEHVYDGVLLGDGA
jgi:hypothetical protein